MDGWIRLSINGEALYLRVEDISAVRESQHYTVITGVDGQTHEVEDDIHAVMREIVRIENLLIGIEE